MAQPLVRAGLSPNQVTAIGFVLIVVVSATWLWHQNPLVYGLTLAVAFVFDALDGAVARQTGLSSKLGGYFDAMVDRYQELIVIGAIAYVSGLWALALLAFSGAILTSYAKARTAIEIPISNEAWPDFFERLERIIYLCVLMVAVGVTGWQALLAWGLGLYALICHGTALQRAARAAAMLRKADQDNR